MTATTEAPAKVNKNDAVYVVTGDTVGQFDRGDVRRASEFAPDTNFPRLLNLGVIRLASANETQHNKVTLPEIDPKNQNVSREELESRTRTEVLNLQEELARERNKNAELMMRLTNHTATVDIQKQEQAYQELLVEKDKVIIGQKDEIERLNNQIREMQQKRSR